MALLEDTNVCAICECQVSGYVDGVPVYYCPRCFHTHTDAIIGRAPWVMRLLAVEKSRRKRRNRLLKEKKLPVFVQLDYRDAVADGG